ncbi:olfactory receptor 2AT4-like [Protopterus annectens]|uniref:olfactory receptor 2AT4-like n=1 Tax=Protopterus annectens TaxID=7888 RepID=UPI001CFB2410|nr:olfactory receptor 2AT4-like [Protopterus annectens]
MAVNNGSVMTFIITGFPGLQNYQGALFSVFLCIYMTTLLGNISIILVIKLENKLQYPMYFFITNLSVLDILYTNTTIPKMLGKFLMDDSSISFHACFLQMFTFLSLSCTEAFLLSVMAYDRYLAICNPLRYAAIITYNIRMSLAAVAWILPVAPVSLVVFLAARLPFCGPNIVQHCFCDHSSVARLACTDITLNSYLGLSIALAVIIIPFIAVVLSYAKILLTVFNITSKGGRYRAFSTCSSHLIVVTVFFASNSIVYISYRIGNVSVDFRIMSAMMYAVLTPMLNPIIYSLRNKDINQAWNRLLAKYSEREVMEVLAANDNSDEDGK